LKLPATKLPKDFHHPHASETHGQRFVTLNDSDNAMFQTAPITGRLENASPAISYGLSAAISSLYAPVTMTLTSNLNSCVSSRISRLKQVRPFSHKIEQGQRNPV
jgi:hypothetical protein